MTNTALPESTGVGSGLFSQRLLDLIDASESYQRGVHDKALTLDQLRERRAAVEGIVVFLQTAFEAENKLAERASAIADSAMICDLQCHGVPIAGVEGAYALVDDEGVAVARLKDAAPVLSEAVEWLQARGLARLDVLRGRSACIMLAPAPSCADVPRARQRE